MNKALTSDQTIQSQYQGYCNTPTLWFSDAVYGLKQLDFINPPKTTFPYPVELPRRLGKRAELFTLHQLSQLPNIQIIAQNIQVQQGNQTLGELDALIAINNTPIHLEIIYKFYLYDATVGHHELDHWIGPNRKDSLVQKLDKLKSKQLPLLQRPETKKYIEKHQLKLNEIKQNVFFKAQLFVPANLKYNFNQLNSNCLAGNYYTKAELSNFETCQFYIPEKNSWLLCDFPMQTHWLDYRKFMLDIDELLQNKRSPLIWIKHPIQPIERAFVVWW